MTVVLNTTQVASPHDFSGPHPLGLRIPVRRTLDGRAYVEIRDVPPAEVIVLANHPEAVEGMVVP